jgi:archaeosine synthase beta-subunit
MNTVGTSIQATHLPHACFSEHERSESGELVPTATILLKNRRCPWRCVYCDLWKDALEYTVPAGAIPAQIDFALKEMAGARTTPRQIKLYNAGSFFDRAAIPPEDFPAIAARVRGFDRVIVECHPALVGEPALWFRDLLMQGASGPTLEVAMGLEIADAAILRRLNKRMTMAMFARAADFLRVNGIAMRAFVIIKPPFVTSEAAAVEFAARSVEFALDCGATAVSLIPARFGTEELNVLADAGQFAPPKFSTIESAHEAGLQLQRGRVFVDLWDIELFADCPKCRGARRQRLAHINEHQMMEPRVRCHCEDLLGERAAGFCPPSVPKNT